MDNDILVKVEGVSKKFCRDLKRSLWYGVKDITTELFGAAPGNGLRKKEFWAVDDVSFELKRGECLGLIGHNGAGKSTLLKMLNGLIKPDRGKITMKGRIGALIELGAGFNPILTGRENIYNNGAVLGFSKKEIEKKFDAIVDFAEIGDFIDTPVQNYSSGMKVRLGFAVAAQMEPDVLIIDEVLAVGDMGFVIKCFNRMEQILKNAAVIFVSHNMPQVFRISNNVLLIDRGRTHFSGNDVSAGIDHYYSNFNFIPTFTATNEVEINSIKLNEIPITNDDKPAKVNRLDDLNIDLEIKIDKKYPNPEVALVFYDKELRGVAEYFYEESEPIFNSSGTIKLRITFSQIIFSKGVYSLTVGVKSNRNGTTLLRAQSVAYFQVISKYNVWTAIQMDGKLTQYNS